jgi:hypothetical protein
VEVISRWETALTEDDHSALSKPDLRGRGLGAARPTLVMPGRRPVTDWPGGLVDLRGLPW